MNERQSNTHDLHHVYNCGRYMGNSLDEQMKLSEAIAALERGEEVEYRPHESEKWFLFNFTTINYAIVEDIRKFDFRLKPKPMEVWANIHKDGVSYAYGSKDQAIRECGLGCKTVLFREVVGEE